MNTSKVTRVEVIDREGRIYHNWHDQNQVMVELQDQEKTLKVFIVNGKKCIERIEAADQQLEELMEWLLQEDREAAQTKFTAGKLRNAARLLEWLLDDRKARMLCLSFLESAFKAGRDYEAGVIQEIKKDGTNNFPSFWDWMEQHDPEKVIFDK